MKKIVKLLPLLGIASLPLPLTLCTPAHVMHSVISKKSANESQQDVRSSVSYELVQNKKVAFDIDSEEKPVNYDEDYIYWYDNEPNYQHDSFNNPYFSNSNPKKLIIETNDKNDFNRFIYQQVKVNITVPAHTEKLDVNFQARFSQFFDNDCEYMNIIQLFDLGDDANAHPEKFNRRMELDRPEVDKMCCFFQRLFTCPQSDCYADAPRLFDSHVLKWSFSNNADTEKTFSKYIGLSYHIQGDSENCYSSRSEGRLETVFATNLDQLNPDINVKDCEMDCWGDIVVRYSLSNDYTCHLRAYAFGHGTIRIPDHISYAGEDYYVREIPSNWSDGENDIEGIQFSSDCRHLTKICDEAFKNTQCFEFGPISYGISNSFNVLTTLIEFPEGLEEIGAKAFYGTAYDMEYMKGFKFPSTLKKIGSKAFGHCPWIEGMDNDGELWFKSIPEIDTEAFNCVASRNDTKYIYGSTFEIAKANADFLRNETDDFNTDSDFLIPRVIE